MATLTPSSWSDSPSLPQGIVYQENIHNDWWLWSNGAWAATSAPLGHAEHSSTDSVELDQADVDAVELADIK